VSHLQDDIQEKSARARNILINYRI